MLKFPKYVTVLFVISLLVALLVTITQAQKTTFPPLPDVKGSPKSLIGATGTPKPNEDRPMDSVAPTVTSRKYVETINMVTKGTLDEDIGKFVKIVCLGNKVSPKTRRSYKDFEVFVK